MKEISEGAFKQLLKGSKMGRMMMEDLASKVKSPTLEKVFDHILFDLYTHEKALSGLLLYYGEDSNYSLDMECLFVEVMNKIKHTMISCDKVALRVACDHMKMAIIELKRLLRGYRINNRKARRIIALIREDYYAIYHNLRKYYILFG